MAERLGEFADENDDVGAIAKGHEALAKSSEYEKDEAAIKAISEKLDQLKIKIVRREKRKKVIDEIEKFVAADAPPEVLKQIRWRIRSEQLDDEPEIVAKLKEVDALLRGKIRYVEAKDTPPPAGVDPIEPSLLVLPFAVSSPQPKSDQKRVVLALDRGVLYALDQFTGKFLWATRVGVDTTALPVRLLRTSTSPEMFLVLSADRNTLMALAATDGAVVWRHKLSDPCLGRPVVVDQRVYVCTFDGRVNEIEINRGTLLGYFDLKVRLRNSMRGGVARRHRLPLRSGRQRQRFDTRSGALSRIRAGRAARVRWHPEHRPSQRLLAQRAAGAQPLRSRSSQPAWRRFAPGIPGPLHQTDGFQEMKLRVFGLPIDSSDASSVLDKCTIRGWSWFEPCHDAEKFAFITDAGFLGLYGINQPGNQDAPIFKLRDEDIRLGSSDSRLVRRSSRLRPGQRFLDRRLMACLQRYYFDLFGSRNWRRPLIGPPMACRWDRRCTLARWTKMDTC